MAVEHAVLPVITGREEDFPVAFKEARPLTAATKGFVGLQLSRSIEGPSHFLLPVSRESVHAHAIGFRGSANHLEWKSLLRHFYGPFPVVEHLGTIEAGTWRATAGHRAASPASRHTRGGGAAFAKPAGI